MTRTLWAAARAELLCHDASLCPRAEAVSLGERYEPRCWARNPVTPSIIEDVSAAVKSFQRP